VSTRRGSRRWRRLRVAVRVRRGGSNNVRLPSYLPRDFLAASGGPLAFLANAGAPSSLRSPFLPTPPPFRHSAPASLYLAASCWLGERGASLFPFLAFPLCTQASSRTRLGPDHEPQWSHGPSGGPALSKALRFSCGRWWGIFTARLDVGMPSKRAWIKVYQGSFSPFVGSLLSPNVGCKIAIFPSFV